MQGIGNNGQNANGHARRRFGEVVETLEYFLLIMKRRPIGWYGLIARPPELPKTVVCGEEEYRRINKS